MTEAPRIAPHRTQRRGGRSEGGRRGSAVARMATRLALACAAAWVTMALMGSWGQSATAASATVGVTSNPTYGNVLTDAQGRALYTFPSDHGGVSACDSNSACASVWPALSVPAGTTATAGPGVSGTVGQAVQANGVYQVTYNGSPLYTFVGDTAPGQVTGNGVGGFLVVVVAATPSTTAPSPAPTAAPTSPPTAVAPTGAPPTTAAPTRTSPAMSAPPAPATAPATSAAAAPSAPSAASPPTLATTGPGPGLWWIALAGVVLVVVPGTTLLLRARPGTRRRGRLMVRTVGDVLLGR